MSESHSQEPPGVPQDSGEATLVDRPRLGDVRVLAEHQTHTIYLVAFESPFPRLGGWNDGFWLRCTLPRRAKDDGNLRSVVVMLNGLGESDITGYDDIAGDLASRGIASILLPLPNHFCRFVAGDINGSPYDLAGADPFRPASVIPELYDRQLKSVSRSLRKRFEGNSSIWIEGYRQAMADLELVIKRVLRRDPDPSMFFENFARAVHVSLYGFSLGGLIALSMVLAHPELIRTCFVINSGASLEEINAQPLFKTEWNKLQLSLLNHFEKYIVEQGRFPYADEFEQIMLGNVPRRRQERLRHSCRRILFLVGATDDIFDVDAVLRVAPKGTGISLMQLPAIGHFITTGSRHKAEWDSWRPFVASLLVDFEENHPADDPLEGSLEIAIRLLAELAPMEEHLRAKVLLHDASRDELVPVAVTTNLVGTWDGVLRFERGKGLCWRVFERGVAQRAVTPQVFGVEDLRTPEEAGSDTGTDTQTDLHGYTPEEIGQLVGSAVATVAEMPLYGLPDATGAVPCLGVVAFASDKPTNRSVLSQLAGLRKVVTCAEYVAGLVEQLGGAGAVLGRALERGPNREVLP